MEIAQRLVTLLFY